MRFFVDTANVEDIKKADWYLKKYIELSETDNQGK